MVLIMSNPIAPENPHENPTFDADFQERLTDLFRWRRDVRRFRSVPVPDAVLDHLLQLASLAPSVGNSQPWRFVKVEDALRRKGVRDIFEVANADALNDYAGERAKLYARLKLDGLDQAPVQLAAFVDKDTDIGQGLGRKTMPETLHYSVVAAINILWLAARAHGVGVGWVSIIDPDAVVDLLDVPDDWALVAYLCVGYPQEEHLDPELERAGWQERIDMSHFVFKR